MTCRIWVKYVFLYIQIVGSIKDCILGQNRVAKCEQEDSLEVTKMITAWWGQQRSQEGQKWRWEKPESWETRQGKVNNVNHTCKSEDLISRSQKYILGLEYLMTKKTLKPTSDLLNWKNRNQIKMLFSLLPFNIVLEVPTSAIRYENEIKKHPDWKGKSKQSLFADGMILYMENAKEFTETELNKLSKVVGYRINI